MILLSGLPKYKFVGSRIPLQHSINGAIASAFQTPSHVEFLN